MAGSAIAPAEKATGNERAKEGPPRERRVYNDTAAPAARDLDSKNRKNRACRCGPPRELWRQREGEKHTDETGIAADHDEAPLADRGDRPIGKGRGGNARQHGGHDLHP